ncbi:MAG: hydrogenase maturation nickel metallochaperone HypA [Sandaracinaceae bacterium]|nr:hydrogenase maturation nickel metallochaperone HypA [Sandaracinaceae bacterium]
MHELGLTREIVSVVAERAGARRVTRVVLEIGKLSAVMPDAVRFCFELCARGTRLEGASLEIVEPAGRARCRACGRTVELERPYGECACGSCDLEWISGGELRVVAMELA